MIKLFFKKKKKKSLRNKIKKGKKKAKTQKQVAILRNENIFLFFSSESVV